MFVKENPARIRNSSDYTERKKEEGVVNSLGRSGAFIVGPAKGMNLPLKALMTNIGFENTHSYTRLEFADSEGLYRDRMNVMIIKTSTREDVWRSDCKLVRILRTRRDLNIALSPVFIISEKVTEGMVSGFVNAGADDVIIIPSSIGSIRQRMISAISRPQPFFRTVTYFGPDRRRFATAKIGAEKERGGPCGAWSRVLIERSPAQGCRILKEEMMDQRIRASA